MVRIRSLTASITALLLASSAPAFADEMTGLYLGTGSAEGVVLELTRDGDELHGLISGVDQGYVSVHVSSETSFEGKMTVDGYGGTPNILIAGTWSLEGVALEIATESGLNTVQFVPVGSDTTASITHAPDDAADALFYVWYEGQTDGPSVLGDMKTLIASEILTGETLMWTPGQADWQRLDSSEQFARMFPAATPEADETATAPAEYYYVEGGVQAGPVAADELESLIAEGAITRSTLVWTAGQADWQDAGSIEILAAIFPPVLPPRIDYYTVHDDQQFGPLSLEELLARIHDYDTEDTDLVWKTGLEDWAMASSFDELANALIIPPPLLVAEPAIDIVPPQLSNAPSVTLDPDLPIVSGWAAQAFTEVRS